MPLSRLLAPGRPRATLAAARHQRHQRQQSRVFTLDIGMHTLRRCQPERARPVVLPPPFWFSSSAASSFTRFSCEKTRTGAAARSAGNSAKKKKKRNVQSHYYEIRGEVGRKFLQYSECIPGPAAAAPAGRRFRVLLSPPPCRSRSYTSVFSRLIATVIYINRSITRNRQSISPRRTADDDA